MSPQLFRTIGLVCCIAAAVLFVLNYTGRNSIGSNYTPFLLFGVGALLLIRSRLMKS